MYKIKISNKTHLYNKVEENVLVNIVNHFVEEQKIKYKSNTIDAFKLGMIVSLIFIIKKI